MDEQMPRCTTKKYNASVDYCRLKLAISSCRQLPLIIIGLALAKLTFQLAD